MSWNQNDVKGIRDERDDDYVRGDRDNRCDRDVRGDRDDRYDGDVRGDRDDRYDGDVRGDRDKRCDRDDRRQRHVHEFQGSTRLAELGERDVHNHRFTGVSGPAIGPLSRHVHRIETRTDTFVEHQHKIIDVFTGPPIWVSRTRHVHFVYGVTTCNDGHRHTFVLATLIENPIARDKHC
ncbi:YmaF family [Clostridium cylindrosporum DSM 605]|uniref:YmaF family n=1 Tax=Clostridium cylindrosporum DSM 605 TaxID=1121307 RepID=A0A0J8G437_CLOCY|nr:YmaF family [Clostridium cylindrosporum DSM 605]